jgi:hypothetical protein
MVRRVCLTILNTWPSERRWSSRPTMKLYYWYVIFGWYPYKQTGGRDDETLAMPVKYQVGIHV